MDSTAPSYFIEVLNSHHDRKSFSCGIEGLDRYLQQQAGQEARRHIAATFILIEINTNIIAGYYTLSSTGIDAGDLPEEMVKKLPRYPILPATLLGRLAVDKRYHGKRLGELLLIDALQRSLNLSNEIASMAVVVDAKNDQAINFYKRYSFIQFSQCQDKLFLSMATIKKIRE